MSIGFKRTLLASVLSLHTFAMAARGADADPMATLRASALAASGDKWRLGVAAWQSTGAGEWQIDGNTSDGTGFRSRLEWDDLDSTMLVLHGVFFASPRVRISGVCGFGAIGDGRNTDSDYYLSSDRHRVIREFSESVSSTEGNVSHLSLNAEWRWFPAGQVHDGIFASDLFCGLFVYKCSVVDSDGVQTIQNSQPVNEPFPGENATYDFTWTADEVGVRCSLLPCPRLRVTLSASALVNVRQDGEGFWMQRADLKSDPPNIENEADMGVGSRLSISVECHPWRHVYLNAGWQTFEVSADNGVHRVHMADGAIAATEMTDVRSNREGFFAGIACRF